MASPKSNPPTPPEQKDLVSVLVHYLAVMLPAKKEVASMVESKSPRERTTKRKGKPSRQS